MAPLPTPPDFLLRSETLFCPVSRPLLRPRGRLPVASHVWSCLFGSPGGGGLPENATARVVGPHAEWRQTMCEQTPHALLPRCTHLPRRCPQGFIFPDWDRGGEKNKGIEVYRHGLAHVTPRASCRQSAAAHGNHQKSPQGRPRSRLGPAAAAWPQPSLPAPPLPAPHQAAQSVPSALP